LTPRSNGSDLDIRPLESDLQMNEVLAAMPGFSTAHRVIRMEIYSPTRASSAISIRSGTA
jgi:hypothetical protein